MPVRFASFGKKAPTFSVATIPMLTVDGGVSTPTSRKGLSERLHIGVPWRQRVKSGGSRMDVLQVNDKPDSLELSFLKLALVAVYI